MYKLVTLILVLFSTFTKAEEADPCDSNDYPVKWQETLPLTSSYALPAIYYKRTNSRVIVPVESVIASVKVNMSSDKPYLAKAKRHILNALKNIPVSELVDQSTLLIPLDGLASEELNIAIHVMFAYQDLFEDALFSRKATVEVDGRLIAETKGKYMTGLVKDPEDEFKFVHKLEISYQDNLIFKKCWVDVK